MKVAGATSITISFGHDVSIAWPAWNDRDVWNVWDARHVRQGALCVGTYKTRAMACKAARALVALRR